MSEYIKPGQLWRPINQSCGVAAFRIVSIHCTEVRATECCAAGDPVSCPGSVLTDLQYITLDCVLVRKVSA